MVGDKTLQVLDSPLEKAGSRSRGHVQLSQLTVEKTRLGREEKNAFFPVERVWRGRKGGAPALKDRRAEGLKR